MTEVRKIEIEGYDYPLPDERIALHPLEKRDACKLLVNKGAGEASAHLVFSDLPLLLRPGTLIAVNETKVIRARLSFRKESGAEIEIFLLEPLQPRDYAVSFAETRECSWVCLVGNKRRWKGGALTKSLDIAGAGQMVLTAEMEAETLENGVAIRFSWDNPKSTFADIVNAAGNIPIPPYLHRESEESDTRDYQTVYSRTEGSVAAPTAGLHFTPELMDSLRKRDNEFVEVTLHVGAGTFQPVKSDTIGDHPMHKEWFSVSKRSISRIIGALETGRDVLAVGTTTVRTLESLPYIGALLEGPENWNEAVPAVTQWMPYQEEYRVIDTIRALKNIIRYLDRRGLERLETETAIMIAPGFRWRVVNRLITNFHQPKSTLLLLVSSFLGDTEAEGARWRRIYDEALKEGYRFLSYGDACLFTRGEQSVELPAAKSMVTRAATIMAGRETSELKNLKRLLLCDDAVYFIEALQKTVASAQGTPESDGETGLTPIYIGEGAAPLRFLTAFAASYPGSRVKITCGESLQRRPILPLLETLERMGAEVRYSLESADWWIEIRGKRLKGENANTDTSVTSQYLSALMLASPLWEGGFPEQLKAQCETASVSKPYLRMTEEMLSRAKEGEGIKIEPDWSAAAFFYEQALITGKGRRIERLEPPADSLQGDAACCGLYARLGVTTEFLADGSAELRVEPQEGAGELIEYDFTDVPDMVPSVAVALCYARRPFRFRGVHHLRFKECDRLSALQRNLMLLGYEVDVENEELVFNGGFSPMNEFPVELDSYADHRMVMAFYPLEQLGMAVIRDKEVVSKSYPNYFANI